jgi:hypothetical protein
MNILDQFRDNPARVLDRLVDGELGQAERRELLATLDDEPGGWRSCALAFLEAQSWRWQLTRLAAEQSLAHAVPAAHASPVDGERSPSGLRNRGWWGACLAVAASVLLAFGLGTRFPATSPSSAPVEKPGASAKVQVAVAPSDEDALDARELSAWDGDESDLASLTDLGSVTLALTDGDETENIELPVAAADESSEQWLEDLETTVPVELMERLRAAGYEVVRHQRLYPVELSDGRRLVVPVEQVEIRDPSSTERL